MDKNKKDTQEYTNVLLEDMRTKFDAFGDSLGFVREKVGFLANNFEHLKNELIKVKDKGEATFEKVGKITEDVNVLKDKTTVLDPKMDSVEKKIDILTKEVNDIKLKLDEHITRNEYYKLKDRVERLEKYIKKYMTKQNLKRSH